MDEWSVAGIHFHICRSKMINFGQKRKLPVEGDEVPDKNSALWENQRQFVFAVSLNKYQRSQELPEPSLRRSVLIANTLRQVSLQPSHAPAADTAKLLSQSPCASSSADHESATQGAAFYSPLMLANGDSARSGCPLVSSENHNLTASLHSCASSAFLSEMETSDDWGSMSMDPELCLSSAISSILATLESTVDGSQQTTARSPLRPLENLQGSCEGARQELRGYGGGAEQQVDGRLRESCTELLRSNCHSDFTVQDLFQDVNSSLLETEMAVLGLVGSEGEYPAADDFLRYLPPLSSCPLSAPHPFSFSLSQNQKCLPSLSPFSPLTSSPSSSLPLSSPSFPIHLRDGLESEHLMEILVES